MRIRGLYVVRSGAPVMPTARAARDGDEGATDEGMPTMHLRFSPYGEWYEINSQWEGRFLERTKRGAFKRTIKNAKREDGRFDVKSLFNHGYDFTVGDKVLGVPTRLWEGDDSPEMDVPLLDTSYNRDLVPGLRDGAYGSSFMFEVLRDSWNHEPEPADYNPEGLPERTIEEVRLYEAGPVTWPANPAATAGVRSGCHTDYWIERMESRDPARARDMMGMFDAFRAGHGLPARDLASAPADEAARHAEYEARTRRARLLEMVEYR